jgi:molecular chaperone DnaK (HSP70)
MTVRVGIDLGTTNSLIAVCREGRIDVLDTVPSIVAETREGQLLVGAEAATCVDPRYRYSHFKRAMGSDTRFELSADAGGPTTAPHLSARVLRRLAETAAAALGVGVGALEVVITVPADFRDNARLATREAAVLAGLELLDLVVEPVAAAAAYSHERPLTKGSEVFAVYDLGGGTFDACICERTAGRIAISAGGEATKGHQTLGGRDLDAAFVSLLLSKKGIPNLVDFESVERRHASQTPAEVWDLRRSAQHQREMLSDEDPLHARLRLGERVVSDPIRRAEFEATIRPLIETTLRLCDEVVLLHARHVPDLGAISPADLPGWASSILDRILLVGGASRTPLVKAALRERYPGVPIELADPEQAVARGAALYSQQHSGARKQAAWLQWERAPLAHLPSAAKQHPAVAGVVDVAGATTLSLDSGAETLDVPLADGGRFSTSAFPVPVGEGQLVFRALGEGRRVLEQTSLRIFHGGDDLGREGIAHDISISLRTRPMVIVKRGHPAGVPAVARTLYVADGSSKIRIPLLEDRYPLGTKELAIEAKVGDPVEITTSWEPGSVRLDVRVGGQSRDVTFELAPRSAQGSPKEALSQFERLYAEAKALLAEPLHQAAGVEERKAELDRLATGIRLSLGIDFDSDRVAELLHDLATLVLRLRLFSLSAEGLNLRAQMLKSMTKDDKLHHDLEDVVAQTKGGEAVGSEILDQSARKLEDVQMKVYLAQRDQPVSATDLENVLAPTRAKLKTLQTIGGGVAPETARQLERSRTLLEELEKDLTRTDPTALRDSFREAVRLSERVSEHYQREVVSRQLEGLLTDNV